MATVGGKSQITASRKTKIVGDSTLEDIVKKNDRFDMICLPGGMPGATNLYNDKVLTQLINDNLKNPKFILGAICASPAVVLSQNGLLKGLEATCYPADKFKKMLGNNGGIYVNKRVVISQSTQQSLIGMFFVYYPCTKHNQYTMKYKVTSQGPGTALEFSFVLVQLLLGFYAAYNISQAMLTLFGTEYCDRIDEIRNKSK